MSFVPRQYRILIVDDNPAIHQDFQKILQSEKQQEGKSELQQLQSELFGVEKEVEPLSYLLDFALSGSQAFEKVSESLSINQPYALAFVDIMMPNGWDGIETTKKLWSVDPDLQIVFCTAYADYSWYELVGQLGINDKFLILKKPFDNVEIRQLACCLTQKWFLNKQVGHQFDLLHMELVQRSNDLKDWESPR